MDLKFINDVVKITLVLAVICFLISYFFLSFFPGLGIFLGALWGCINLFLIKYFMQSWLVLCARNYLKIYAILVVKFPLLYWAGYKLMKMNALPILSLAVGFSLILVSIFIESLREFFKVTGCSIK